ncbi:hypothetical protein N431DRAFT_432993 [Stipitochalara longipes BDJ]|nr:hypothetical protein N431DRAFT_432993 [Stipitochalara longipes BDJ]
MAHHFHLTCIFTFWDQPGKYLHNCPTCGEAAQLNWDRVGIDYKKTLNFAHNLMGWTVDHNTIANIYEDSAAGRKARAAYDVPPMPPHRDRSIIHPNDVSDGTLLWWMQQNMTSLCALENPISWKPMEFEPGQLARIRNAWIDTPYNSRPFDRVARDLGRRWMNLEFDTGGRIRDPTQNVHGVDRKRMLHGTRYSPSQEAAWVRAQRRRRDRVRREAVRASGSGLVNLPGI